MKNMTILFLILFFQHFLIAQEPSITLDPTTGNYIIRYQGYDGQKREVIFEPATKVYPNITACLYYESDSGLYKYEYKLKNDLKSQQRLLAFMLNYYAPLKSIKTPNEEWGIGFFSYRQTIDWSNDMISSDGMATPYDGIAPDSSVSGFTFISSGLPVIVTCYFEGASKGLAFPDEPPEKVSELLRPLREFPANTVKRKILGPKNPPDPFIYTDFLGTLISYKHQAYELGWIDNQGIVNSLNKKLEHAKEQLDKGKTKQAINHLNTFINEVNAQEGKHLSSEAYALLKYNAEYLIEKLEE